MRRKYRMGPAMRTRGGFINSPTRVSPGVGTVVGDISKKIVSVAINRGSEKAFEFAVKSGVSPDIATPIISMATDFVTNQIAKVVSSPGNLALPGLSPSVKNRMPARELGLGVKATAYALKGKAKLMRGMNVARSTIVSSIGNTLGVTSTSQYGRQLCTLLGDAATAFVVTNNTTSISNAATDLFSGSTLAWKMQPAYVSVKYAFSNMDRVTAVIDLYDCLAAQDMTNITGSLWDPVSTFIRAQSQYTSLQGSVSVDDLDVTPMKNYYFGKYWNILKKTTIYLAPGETHEHTFTMNGMYALSRARIDSNATFFKGVTYCPMAIIKSCPIRDSGGTNAVTLGTPDIIFTAIIKQGYRGQLVTPITRRESAVLPNTLVGIQNIRLVNNPQEVEAGDTSNIDTTADRTNE